MPQTECIPQKGVSVQEKQENNGGINPGFISATTVIGDKVKGKDGKELGKIEDIMMNLTTGTITYLVLSTGGILGIADKFFALPLEHLSFDKEERVFYMDISRDTLKKQPGFDKEQWPEKATWPIVKNNK
jgi:sporulation protein YlmC with PRC-barrel domain